MYLTAPFVGLFSPTAFSVRLPVALLGVLSVLLIYYVAVELFKNRTLGVIAAFLLAITPWHIHYSRAAFEVVPLVFLILLGTLLFLKGKLYAGLIPFVLTFYTYSTANIFTPFYLLILLLVFRPRLSLLRNWPRLLLPVLLVLPMGYNLLFDQAANRFGLISIFNDPKITQTVILDRTAPWVKDTLAEQVLHNKFVEYFGAFSHNYLQSLSINFLFLNGDPYFRHSVSKTGELLWPNLILFFFGLYALVKHFEKPSSKLLLFWLLLSPIPSSLTQGGGEHATRLFLMVPVVILISALGGKALLDTLKFHRAFVVPGVFGTLFLIAFVFYFHRYSAHYRYESYKYWDYGYTEIFGKLSEVQDNYDKIYINNFFQPTLVRFAFFAKYPPAKFQKDFTTDNWGSYKTDLFKGFRFGEKYYFGELVDADKDPGRIVNLLDQKTLYFAVQSNEVPGDWDWSKDPPSGVKAIESQKDVYGKPLFYLLTSDKPYNQ